MPIKKAKQFSASASAESAFARSLKKVARVSAHIVEAHVDGHKIQNTSEMKRALTEYAALIDPWAKRQAARMLEKVARKNRSAYTKRAKEMGQRLQSQLLENGMGPIAFTLMNEQVELIKSIPLRAGERAQKLAMEAAINGTRASEVAEELRKSGQVSESQAMLIARTEVARANASITQARAEGAGATGYIWRTTMDGAERDSHRKMNGKIISYDQLPELSDGTRGHAGTFPNCRCYQDPIFDEA